MNHCLNIRIFLIFKVSFCYKYKANVSKFCFKYKIIELNLTRALVSEIVVVFEDVELFESIVYWRKHREKNKID